MSLITSWSVAARVVLAMVEVEVGVVPQFYARPLP
jgi:hypothetical protein